MLDLSKMIKMIKMKALSASLIERFLSTNPQRGFFYRFCLASLFLLPLVLLPFPGHGQSATDDENAATTERQSQETMLRALKNRFQPSALSNLFRDPEFITDVPADMRTPRAMVSAFLQKCDNRDYDEAAQYLDFSLFNKKEAEDVRESYVRQLYLLLRTVKLIDLSEIPDHPHGTMVERLFRKGKEDFAPVEIIVSTEQMESAGLSPRSEAQKSFLNLALVRSDADGHGKIGGWHFSKYNVRDIPFWYDQIGYGTVGKILPTFMIEVEFLSIQLWQYLLLILVIFLGLVLNKFVKHLISRRLKRIGKNRHLDLGAKLLDQMTAPIGFFVMAIVYWIAIPYLLLPADISKLLLNVAKGMATFAAIWFLYRAVDMLGEYMYSLTSKTESTLDDQLVPLVRKTLKVFVVIIGIIFGLQNFNVDVMGFMAGLGIGGLAFALAAKDTVANFFGSMTIFTDKPFEMGSWIKVAGIEGIVEEIGFRSTRVRTFAQSLISIPNSMLITSPVEHITARNRQRILTNVSVTYDTKPEDIEWLVAQIIELIKSNDKFFQDYYQVRFAEMGDFSLKIMVYCFVYSTDWGVYLKEREWFYLEIMKLCEKKGIEFAFPTQTVELKKEG